MRHSSQGLYRLKLPVKLVIFGLWGATFAMVVLYFSIRMLSAVTSLDMGVLGADAGINLSLILVESIMMVYRGGLVSLGVGGALMVLGGIFLISPKQ